MAQLKWFVVFASMRTGSNFLEANLNALDGVACLGEAFNPHFIAYPNTTDLLGFTQSDRDKDPLGLLGAIRGSNPEMSGFRYFPDHDPRIFDEIIQDKSCAKIVLTRNPVESYVSWKIAQSTGQWKLTDAKSRKDGQAQFDKDEFEQHLGDLQDFQLRLLNALQEHGQTAFYVDYEDLRSLPTLNGLAAYLGVKDRLDSLDQSLKVQNPKSVEDKVANVPDMRAALASLDRFNLSRTPNFEPRRGPAVPTYMLSETAPLLYLPVKGTMSAQVRHWMEHFGPVSTDLARGDVRKWMRQTQGRRSFTILRHPLARAHAAFCERILNLGDGGFPAIRKTLKNRYDVQVPLNDKHTAAYDIVAHRSAFAAFLTFLNANLAGQTVVRIDPHWASQTQIVQGFSEFAPPDRIIRQDTAQAELAGLAQSVGLENAPEFEVAPDEDTPFALSAIYDAELEQLARKAYARDYVTFGFENWAG